jgi:arylsulfatase A-like enzyme
MSSQLREPHRTGGSPSRQRILSRFRLKRFAGTLSGTPPLSAFTICGSSSWIGFASGLAESMVRLSWRFFERRVSDPDLWVNWHAPWLAPLGLALLFIGFGVVVSLAYHVAPRATAFLAPFVLIGLGAWSALGAIPALNPWAAGLLVAGLAVRLGGHARFDSGRFRRLVRASLPYAAGLWVALFVTTGIVPAASEAWALASGSVPPQHSPNVLLIVLDTVRADNLSLHGYERLTSTNLERWARRGVLFKQARATTPFTLGTHASLFTGHWMSETSARVNAALDGTRRTLAEHLRDRGYATGGFVGNIFYGSAHYGLDRGFLHYHDIPGNITRRVTLRELLRSCRLGSAIIAWCERKWRILVPMQRLRLDAGEVNREALAWIDKTRAYKRPYFLFVNYFDAHYPYTLPGEASQPFSRRPAEMLEAKLKRLKQLEEIQDNDPASAVDADISILRTEVNALVRDAYDDGIAWIDRQLDELLREFERRGMLDDTLIVVTADHGEMLGEHDLMGHGNSLERQLVHVPLLIVGARGMRVPAGEVVQQPVSLRDVPATVLELLGDAQASRFPGRSLSRFWTEDQNPAAAEGPVLSEVEHLSWMRHTPRTPAAFGPMWLLTEGRWSYHRQEHETLGLQERLYDFVNDPGEDRDLATDPAHRKTLESLRERFEQARAPSS